MLINALLRAAAARRGKRSSISPRDGHIRSIIGSDASAISVMALVERNQGRIAEALSEGGVAPWAFYEVDASISRSCSVGGLRDDGIDDVKPFHDRKKSSSHQDVTAIVT